MSRARSTSGIRRPGGFTLIEVLMTLMLVAIVLPAINQGVMLAVGAASAARHRTEAAGLAEAKLAEIVSSETWQQSSLSGDFAPDWPDYHWKATVQTWALDTSDAGLQQIDLKVSWHARNREDSLVLSTLTYARSQTEP